MLARTFVTIGGLVVLALVVALVAPLFIDWTSYRADFERQASAILGRPVAVAGSASARLIPFPSVTFTDVRVGGGAGEPAMTAESFSMDAELAPFLSGNILIFDMRIDRPRARIVVAADGSVDWTARPETGFDPAKVALEKVTITDGEISIIHGPGVRKHVLRDLDATLSAKSLVGPIQVAGRAMFDKVEASFSLATGKPDKEGLRVLFRIKPRFAGFELETDGAARLDKGRLAYGGSFMIDQTAATPLRGEGGATVGGPPSRVVGGWRARGEFTADALKIDAPNLRFETGPTDAPQVAEGSATIDLGEAAHFALSLEGHQVTLNDKADGDKVPLADRLSAFAAALTDAPKPPIPGVVDARIPAIVAGDTTLRDVVFRGEAAENGWSIAKLSAELPGRTTIEASGFLAGGATPSFSGDLIVAIGQPSGFAAWLGQEIDEAIRRLPGAGVAAKVALNRDRQVFSDMEVRIGEAAFSGSAARESSAGSETSVAVDMRGGALDLPALQALASIFAAGGVDRFSGASLDLKLAAGPVDAGSGLVAEKVDTALRLRGGRLEIDRLLIDGIEDAHVSATAKLDGFPGALSGAVDLSVNGSDLAPLVSRLAGREPAIPGMAWLARRAGAWPGLLGDARLDMVATIAAEDSARRHAISAHGKAGGSDFTFSAAASFDANGLMKGRKVTIAYDGKNDDSGALMALAGVPALPLALTPEGRLAFEASGRPDDRLGVTLALNAGEDAFRISGEVDKAGAFTGEAEAKAQDAGPWLLTGGIALPGMAEGLPVEFKSAVAYKSGRLSLPNLSGALSGEKIAGETEWTLKDGRPDMTGRIAIDGFDLRALLRAVFGDDAASGSADGWSDLAFVATPTLPFTGEIEVASQRIDIGGGLAIAGASMSLSLRPEGIAARAIKGDLAGGRFSGFGEMRNIGGEGAIAINGALENGDVAALGGLAGLSGKATINLAMTGGGRTAESLVSSLAGSGAVSFEHVGLAGVDAWALDAIVGEADAAGAGISTETAEAIVRQRALSGLATFGPAESAITVAGGVARAENLRLSHAAAAMNADIRLDLAGRSVEAKADFAYSAGDHAIVGAEPAIGFVVTGLIGAPTITADVEPFGRFLLQRALEKEQARIEALQAALAEKQRLRREVRYFAWLADERARVAAEEEARRAAEEEARKAAEEAALKAAAEEAARARAAEEEAAKVEAEKKAEEEAAREKAAEAAAKNAAAEAAKAAPANAKPAPAPAKKPAAAGPASPEVFPEAPKPKPKFGGLFDFLKPKTAQ